MLGAVLVLLLVGVFLIFGLVLVAALLHARRLPSVFLPASIVLTAESKNIPRIFCLFSQIAVDKPEDRAYTIYAKQRRAVHSFSPPAKRRGQSWKTKPSGFLCHGTGAECSVLVFCLQIYLYKMEVLRY